jgi:hypothetical protein
MRKFIHSKFELDLSNFATTTQEENHWFSDSFFSKYTLPFELILDEKLDDAFGFISFYSSTKIETLFEGYFFENGQKYRATLEVEEDSDYLQCSIFFGFEEFPSFSKKLAELPLGKFEVEDIYDHASEIITQTWPEVNYNFPQIHIDKIDNESDPWLSFEKIINNYKDGAFLKNYVDEVEEIIYNQNIMQPLVYVLHVLKIGIAEGGFQLSGDILSNESFKKMTLYADVEYYKSFVMEGLTISILGSEAFEQGYQLGYNPAYPLISGYDYRKYSKIIPLPNAGRYQLSGTIKFRVFRWANPVTSFYKISYRGNILKEFNIYSINENQPIYTKSIDLIFETHADVNPHEIIIESLQGEMSDETIIADLSVDPILFFNSSGDAFPSIINPNVVDLSKAVPDITFGDFFNTLKNWFNWSVEIIENTMYINFVRDEIKRQPVIDLTQFEVKKPKRKFSKGMSFLLKYQEIDNADFKYESVFQSAAGVLSDGYIQNEKTNEITINALPLPFFFRNNIQTAYAFDSDNSKLNIVFYDGMTAGLNLSKDISELLMPTVHLKYYKDWFSFRINAQNFVWTFKCYPEDIFNLRAKGKVFAYGLEHIVKNLSKTLLSENVFEIEIECESSLK